MENTEENKDETCEAVEETPEQETTETVVEQPDEKTVEELQETIRELEEKIAKLEEEKEPADKRVAGMQSKMQAQINDKTREFETQMKAKIEELDACKKESINLKAQLDSTLGELAEMSSALKEKTLALETLHSGALAKPADKIDWRSLNGKQFWDFLKQHPELTK